MCYYARRVVTVFLSYILRLLVNNSIWRRYPFTSDSTPDSALSYCLANLRVSKFSQAIAPKVVKYVSVSKYHFTQKSYFHKFIDFCEVKVNHMT